MSATNNRIELARELVEFFLKNIYTIQHGNGEIVALLGGEEDYEGPYPPGETAEEIRATLERALALASQPVPPVTSGRNREENRRRSELQRKELRIWFRTAIALLETVPAAAAAPGTNDVPAQDGYPAEIELYANSAPFARAFVKAGGPLVILHTTEPSTRFSSTLEVHPRVARALAAALLEAADLAEKGGQQ